MDKHMPCILTFDLEEWYHGAYPGYDYSLVNKDIVRVDKVCAQILEILDEVGARATFFVLGEIAEKHRSLIEEVSLCGHEVASHGFNHIRATVLGPDKFKIDVLRSIDVLASITGKVPRGFRAPNFSLNPLTTPWAFEILESLGFEYDSSVFPAIMYYGGATKSCRFIHKIGSLDEFPPSCFDFKGVRVSFSGGFYFRVYPRVLIERGIKSYWRRNKIPVLYIHPKDIDPLTPPLPLGPIKNFVHRGFATKGMEKFKWLVRKFNMISIEEYREQKEPKICFAASQAV